MELVGGEYYRFNDLKQLEDLSLAKSTYDGVPLLPCTLKSLCLSGGSFSETSWEDCEGMPGTINLEQLESLRVCNWWYPRERFAHLLSTCKGKLRHLTIKHIGALGDNVMDFLDAEILRSLETLILPASVNASTQVGTSGDVFQDHHAARLAQETPNLRELDLSASRVTGVGIKALVHKVGKPLKKLTVIDYRGCISFDAITYARNHGIEVVFQGEDGKSLGGKVVRTG